MNITLIHTLEYRHLEPNEQKNVDSVVQEYAKRWNIPLKIVEDVNEARTNLPPVPAGFLRLYRGDSSKIDQFEVGKTSLMNLFGQGIYLTDNKRVAGDYTSKGNQGNVIFRMQGRNLTKQTVIDAYVRQKARMTDLTGKEDFYGQDVKFSDGGQWGTIINDLRKREYETRIEIARQKWQKMSRDYEVRIKLDGTGVIQKKPKHKAGAVTVFDIPEVYFEYCLYADREVNDRVLDCLAYVLKKHGDAGTARDMYDFVKNEKWNDNDLTFRQVYTSITSNSPLKYDAAVQAEFIEELQEAGYNGIEYTGGITMGGGYKHRAFVFWDENDINRFRVA